MLGKYVQIKKIAERVFDDYELCVPINFENFPSDSLTITTEERDLHVDGYILLNSKLTEIKINSRVPSEQRKRFTIAHELGHYFIPWHSGIVNATMDISEEKKSEILELQEKEADLFAAFLLMPDNFLIKILEEFQHKPFEDLLCHLTAATNVSLIAAVRGFLRVSTGCYVCLVECVGKPTRVYSEIENLVSSLGDIDIKDYLSTVCLDQSTYTEAMDTVTLFNLPDIPNSPLIIECYNTSLSLDECYDH